jgi:hypothetical protein
MERIIANNGGTISIGIDPETKTVDLIVHRGAQTMVFELTIDICDKLEDGLIEAHAELDKLLEDNPEPWPEEPSGRPRFEGLKGWGF